MNQYFLEIMILSLTIINCEINVTFILNLLMYVIFFYSVQKHIFTRVNIGVTQVRLHGYLLSW